MKIQQLPKTSLSFAVALLLGSQIRTECFGSFVETDLVSDVSGRAAHVDPNLVNPWGISLSSTSPFWVANNGTGVSTLYDGDGVARPLIVTVPPPAGGVSPAKPTGTVFSGSTSFELQPGQPARFLFAAEDGTISGWNPSANPTQAILKVDNSGAGAVYKGLAIGNNGSGDFLYAANFHGGTIDAFDSAFAPASLPGSFTDPTLPSGFAPFNIQNLGGSLYVTFAQRGAGSDDDVAGAGHGYVDVFDLNGNFVKRLAGQGPLNSPWGLAIAPAGFGSFGNDLLVGNFGDGLINAFDPVTGAFRGTLTGKDGNPLAIPGLWALTPGNGASGGSRDDLYFTAGIDDERHGLFGKISATVPESVNGGALLMGAMITMGFFAQRRRPAV